MEKWGSGGLGVEGPLGRREMMVNQQMRMLQVLYSWEFECFSGRSGA
jgi:hypothetical protein